MSHPPPSLFLLQMSSTSTPLPYTWQAWVFTVVARLGLGYQFFALGLGLFEALLLELLLQLDHLHGPPGPGLLDVELALRKERGERNMRR